MKTAQYRQHIIAKLAPVPADIVATLHLCEDKATMRHVLRRADLLAPQCQAITHSVTFGLGYGKQTLVKCGKAITIWWDHELGVAVCRSCAAKLNSSGTQRCTKVPSKKRKA